MEPSKEPPSGRPILIGAAVALAAGLASAVALLVLGRPGSGPPPASEGGLVVEAGPRGDAPAPVEVLSPAGSAEPKAAPAAASAAACWRHTGADWRRLPGEMSQLACVQALFAGRCEPAGSASYGRWGVQTLRLVTGRVEVSNDNRTFRLLLEQGPNCTFAPAGVG